MRLPSRYGAVELDEAVELERLAAEERRRANVALGERALLLLAAPPLWTESLARALPAELQFPVGDLRGFVEHAVAEGRCEWRETVGPDGDEELRFWVPARVRRQTLEDLRASMGAEQLGDDAHRLAGAVLNTATRVHVPPAVTDWARLVRASRPDLSAPGPPPALVLVELVRRAVDEGDLPRAQQLQGVAEALAPLLLGEMELALTRAQRLVDLGYRRRTDERMLGRYLRRPELDALVLDLLDRGRQWALHLQGAGGVGKTMLIRDIASGRFAEDHKRPRLVVARADFDHLSADFPVREPVALLITVADELALYTAADPRSDERLSSFRRAAVSAHEALATVRDHSGRADLDHPLVARAIELFGRVLVDLGQPVLLVLDTCEELAKAFPGDATAPGVEATFTILERLHAAAPAVRVLLAGRRRLPARDFLRAEVVPGFSEGEARRYLDGFATRPLDPPLVDAILAQSPAVDEPDRYNPFDLALHLAWAESDDSLTARSMTAAGGTNAYVQARIVDRLGDPRLVAVLAEVAALGEVTVASLEAALDEDDAHQAEGTFRRLAEQEWVEVDGFPPRTLTVKPNLLRRLRSYYEADSRRAKYEAEVGRLARRLTTAIGSGPLPELEATVLGALRVATPEQAARLWDSLVARVEHGHRWGWALNVARRVLGEWDEHSWVSSDALRATVSATFAAALRRAEPNLDRRVLWAEVARWAGQHPSPGRREELLARAAFGCLPEVPGERADAFSLAFRATPTSALAAAAVDCVDRLLEDGHVEWAAKVIGSPSFGAASDGLAGRAAAVWARTLAWRAQSAEGQLQVTLEELRVLAEESGWEPAWADWVPPADLVGRVFLEQAVAAYAAATPMVEVPLDVWEEHAWAGLSGVDRERLASQCLRLRLAWGPVPREALGRWADAARYEPERRPTCAIHDAVPPLFAALAEGYTAIGDAARSVELVERHRSAALEARSERADDSTQRAADAATVALARRLRDRSRNRNSVLARLSRADTQPPWLRDAARRAKAVLDGGLRTNLAGRSVYVQLTEDPAAWHAWWQCVPADEPELPSPAWQDPPASPIGAAIEADVSEMDALGRVEEAASLRLRFGPWFEASRSVVPSSPAVDPFEAARARLRLVAMRGARPGAGMRVPTRRLAELAFEEAELAALKDLASAEPLFRLAADRFRACGDPLGELLACLADPGAGEGVLGAAVAGMRSQHPEHPLAGGAPVSTGLWTFWSAVLHERRPARKAAPAEADVDDEAAAAEPVGQVPAPTSPPRAQPNAPAGDGPTVQPGDLVCTVCGEGNSPVRRYCRRCGSHVRSLDDPRQRPVSVGSAAPGGPPRWPSAGAPKPRRPETSLLRSGRMLAVRVVAAVAIVVLALLAWTGLRAVVDGFPPTLGRYEMPSWAGELAVILGVAAVAAAARSPGAAAAEGRQLGHRPLRRLRFRAEVTEDAGSNGEPTATVRLLVELRGLREAPPGGWLPLAAAHLLDLPGRLRRRHPPGYVGRVGLVTQRVVLSPPLASDKAWWKAQSGSAPGLLAVERVLAGHPWERVLAVALRAPEAAARVAWTRVSRDVILSPIADGAKSRPAGVALLCPDAWVDLFRTGYADLLHDSASPARVLHVVGEAVETASGAGVEIDGGRREGGSLVVSADELAGGGADLVVVQRPPTDGPMAPALDPELAAQLELARQVWEGGAAVLVLPALSPKLTGRVLPLLRDAARRPVVTAALLAELNATVHAVLADSGEEGAAAVAADVLAFALHDRPLHREDEM